MLCYAITERTRYGGGEPERCEAVLDNVRQWAAQGIAFIQMREKDLAAAEQEKLAQAMQKILDSTGSRLLVNSRADVALSAGAAGVHLTSAPGGLTPEQVRLLYARAGRPAPVVSVSCHTLHEVERAREQQLDFILFGPVFGKTVAGRMVTPAAGLSLPVGGPLVVESDEPP